MKRPSFQFYPGDWLHDTALKSCSLEARGLWIEMLCLMHQGQPYGHLTIGQKRVEADVLARMVGTTEKALRKTMKELEEAEVFARTDTGIIFSRRMVRDEAVREARAAGGVKSLEHPNVPQRKAEGPGKGSAEGYPSPISFGGSPSSSSSSSSEEKKKNDSSPAVNASPSFADKKEESALKIAVTADSEIESQVDSEIISEFLKELPASGTVDDLFKVFWKYWPNKKHKKQAQKAFAALGPGVDLLREILKELDRQQWDGRIGTQLPENWLSDQPWKDE